MREQVQRKISFQGIIKSVQPRSTVWRYRLDNRTHRTVGYNIFLTGIADGEEKDFAIATLPKIYPRLPKFLSKLDTEKPEFVRVLSILYLGLI